MNTIKKILIPVDFSDSSEAAIRYVLGMAKHDSTVKCDLICVAPKPSTEEELTNIKRGLEKLAAEYFIPVHIETESFVKKGEVIPILLKSISELEADLVVMGTAGRESSEIDSHTSEFIKAADCPVLVVPKNTEGFELKNIALALDDNEIDEAGSLSILHDLARWYDARIHLLTVEKEKGKEQKIMNANEDTLEYYLDTLDYHHSFEKNTDIELGLRNYVEDKNIDVLAIMPRTHAKHSERSDGRLTNLLALHSNKPLLVID